MGKKYYIEERFVDDLNAYLLGSGKKDIFTLEQKDLVTGFRMRNSTYQISFTYFSSNVIVSHIQDDGNFDYRKIIINRKILPRTTNRLLFRTRCLRMIMSYGII